LSGATKRKFSFPSPPKARITRSRGSPTCCTFGRHCFELYDEFFFCSNCDEWDQRELSRVGRKDVKRPQQLSCTAGHTSFYFPTTRRKGFMKVSPTPVTPRKSSQLGMMVVLTILMSSTFSPAADEEINVHSTPPSQVNRHLQVKIADLERKLENNKKLISYYKGEMNKKRVLSTDTSPSDKNLELDEAIMQTVNDLLRNNKRFSCYSKLCWERLIAKAIFDSRFGLGMSLRFIIARAKLWLRSNVFTAHAVLKEMDLTGGADC